MWFNIIPSINKSWKYVIDTNIFCVTWFLTSFSLLSINNKCFFCLLSWYCSTSFLKVVLGYTKNFRSSLLSRDNKNIKNSCSPMFAHLNKTFYAPTNLLLAFNLSIWYWHVQTAESTNNNCHSLVTHNICKVEEI